jgi:hypothetical protein
MWRPILRGIAKSISDVWAAIIILSLVLNGKYLAAGLIAGCYIWMRIARRKQVGNGR